MGCHRSMAFLMPKFGSLDVDWQACGVVTRIRTGREAPVRIFSGAEGGVAANELAKHVKCKLSWVHSTLKDIVLKVAYPRISATPRGWSSCVALSPMPHVADGAILRP